MSPPKTLVYCGINKCESFAPMVPKFDVCFGFEADPQLAKEAKARYAGQPNVHIIHAAVCEVNGPVDLNVHDSAVASSLGQLGDAYRANTGNEIRPVRKVTVPGVNLYEYLNSRNVHHIDYYLSDIQGMDFTVLNTLRPMIERQAIKVICCETERDGHGFQSYDGLPSNRQSRFRELLDRDYLIVKMQKVEPNWTHQDVTWRLKPRHLMRWHLRRARAFAARVAGFAARARRKLTGRPSKFQPAPPELPAHAEVYEHYAPPAWPESPAMPATTLAALGAHAPNDELSVPAHWLLTPYRFDVPAKYVYARFRDRGVSCRFAHDLYAEHLKVWNNLCEFDPVKQGLEAYLDAFHRILDSTKSEGFDPGISQVPVGRSLSPVNGGHRVAACLLYGKDVGCRVTDEALESHNYNYLYFRNREANVPGGLAPKWQNAIALEYCRLKPQTYAALVFPSAEGKHREIMDILLSWGHVVYEKEFHLGPRARLNLIRCIYAGEPWLGDARDGYGGTNAKVAYCFARPGPLRLFIFETYAPESVARAKAEIRGLFGLDKHSVHINDSHEETISVTEALLNANSLHFLENAKPDLPVRLLQYMAALRQWLGRFGLSPEDVCIGGSAVLAAYGMREGKDLDFLHHFPLPVAELPPELGSHNEYAGLYGLTADDLIYDPANHFHYGGFKFVSLPIIARMKKARGERKDAVDLSLMQKAL
jgi:FkbM family methyltransferase